VPGNLFRRAKVLFRQSEPETSAVAPRKAVNPHHAVVVVPGRHACAAAYALRGRRFLSREAPVLPLTGCGAGECSCRYEHHDDRRSNARRARDLAVAIDGYDGPEQRDATVRGRRKTDNRKG
jgi:hypothetical protein